MSRNVILSRIRRASESLRQRTGHDIAVDRTPPAAQPAPFDACAHLAAFKTHAEENAITVHLVSDEAAWQQAIVTALKSAEQPMPALRIANRGLAARLARFLSEPVKTFDMRTGPATPDDTASLSPAVSAIAETGSVVLISSQESPATLAFLPLVHIVTVRKDDIVATLNDAMEKLTPTLASPTPPRVLHIISGASRTGDLGGKIVAGAHGPKHLHVIVERTQSH